VFFWSCFKTYITRSFKLFNKTWSHSSRVKMIDQKRRMSTGFCPSAHLCVDVVEMRHQGLVGIFWLRIYKIMYELGHYKTNSSSSYPRPPCTTHKIQVEYQYLIQTKQTHNTHFGEWIDSTLIFFYYLVVVWSMRVLLSFFFFFFFFGNEIFFFLVTRVILLESESLNVGES
jgi:hypothetical protein